MTGLLDIAPPEARTEVIDIRGKALEVRGLRKREYVAVLHRFPSFRRPADENDFDAAVANLDIMAPIVAAGLGKIGDRETEANLLERLSDDELEQVFNTVMRLTLPSPSPLAETPAAAGEESANQPPETPTPPSP